MFLQFLFQLPALTFLDDRLTWNCQPNQPLLPLNYFQAVTPHQERDKSTFLSVSMQLDSLLRDVLIYRFPSEHVLSSEQTLTAHGKAGLKVTFRSLNMMFMNPFPQTCLRMYWGKLFILSSFIFSPSWSPFMLNSDTRGEWTASGWGDFCAFNQVDH